MPRLPPPGPESDSLLSESGFSDRIDDGLNEGLQASIVTVKDLAGPARLPSGLC